MWVFLQRTAKNLVPQPPANAPRISSPAITANAHPENLSNTPAASRILAPMTQASARTPRNSDLPALIQHWLEAGVRALIELVQNLLHALRTAHAPGAAQPVPVTPGERAPSTTVIPGEGAKRRRPGTQPTKKLEPPGSSPPPHPELVEGCSGRMPTQRAWCHPGGAKRNPGSIAQHSDIWRHLSRQSAGHARATRDDTNGDPPARAGSA